MSDEPESRVFRRNRDNGPPEVTFDYAVTQNQLRHDMMRFIRPFELHFDDGVGGDRAADLFYVVEAFGRVCRGMPEVSQEKLEEYSQLGKELWIAEHRVMRQMLFGSDLPESGEEYVAKMLAAKWEV